MTQGYAPRSWPLKRMVATSSAYAVLDCRPAVIVFVGVRVASIRLRAPDLPGVPVHSAQLTLIVKLAYRN
ncbi:MAG: hypothetical protein ACRDRU_23265 [Pseudonocardiaceae bacterium]